VFPQGGKESGALQIVEVGGKRVRFHLDVTMNPSADDDGAQARSGVVGEGELESEGDALIFRSSEGEPSLGTCVLAVRKIDSRR
jgi:hypothetical protein